MPPELYWPMFVLTLIAVAPRAAARHGRVEGFACAAVTAMFWFVTVPCILLASWLRWKLARP